ncbi:MAG: c-type cytochrome [Verrucomicrobia bacterium]|nr:c-type cytochrome [Verrucomicrobiota bacterium]
MKLCIAFCLFATTLTVAAQQLDPARVDTMIEALSRLEPEQVKSNERLREALSKVLAATRGTPRFVKLVEQFKLTDQNAGLLEVATKNPDDEAGVTAARLVLNSKDAAALNAALAGTNATGIVQALGNTADRQTVPLLVPLLSDSKRDVATRKAAVRALARTQDGAAEVLKLARESKLADDLKFTASAELNAVRWPQIKAEAAKLLPLPPAQSAQPLPPVGELLKMAGDAERGEAVFFREISQCSKCHVVNGKGTDFGPQLSEIGAKLGKDALYEAILDPSAGISMGFEAWNVELKNGDETFGLIVSDAADELAVKIVGGLVTRYKKADIAKRTQSKLSIMPAGLQQTMSAQDLVDLVEFLSSLKKAK